MEINPILEKMYLKIPNYCHVVEVESVYELESIIESLYAEFNNEYEEDEIIEFISSLPVYSLNDDNEDEIYNFNITEFLTNLI